MHDYFLFSAELINIDYFFNLLEGATGRQISGLARLLITGVSPVTMDDVTRGFSIGTNISIDRCFNEMIGLTEAEAQLYRYAQDAHIAQAAQQVTMKKLVLIYKGWELVYASAA
ncbi:MAG: AAA family ATPase [Caldilineaceae bacterium]